MKFCTKCGTQNTDEAQVCVKCQSYLPNINTLYNRNSKIKPNAFINIFGVINGVAAVILGIITFCLSSLRQDTLYILEKEMGEELNTFLDLFLSPAKIFSFGMGSLLIVLGLFLILYFVDKIIKNSK